MINNLAFRALAVSAASFSFSAAAAWLVMAPPAACGAWSSAIAWNVVSGIGAYVVIAGVRAVAARSQRIEAINGRLAALSN